MKCGGVDEVEEISWGVTWQCEGGRGDRWRSERRSPPWRWPPPRASPWAHGRRCAANAKVNLTFWFWGDSTRPARTSGWPTRSRRTRRRTRTSRSRSSSRPPTPSSPRSRPPPRPSRGPDIGAQWATGPVLTQVWGGAVTADLRPRAARRDQALAQHVGEHLRRQGLGDAALPDRHPLGLQQGAAGQGRHHRRRSRRGADLITACTALRAKDITPFAFGNDTYWTTQLMLQSLNSLQDVVEAVDRQAEVHRREVRRLRARPGSRWSTPSASTTTSPRSAWQGPGAVRRRQGRDDDRHRRQGARSGRRTSAPSNWPCPSGRSSATARSRTRTTRPSRPRTS